MDVKQQHNPHPDKDLPNDSQTNIHSEQCSSARQLPNNKHLQSVSHPKPGPTQDPLFFTIFYFPEWSLYANRERRTILSIHNMIFTLWTSFNECVEGVGLGERGLGGIPMEGCLLKWIGVGFWHMEKDDQCAYCPFSNLPAHLNKLISLSFSPFSFQ